MNRELQGIPIGHLGEPSKPAIQVFKRLGINASPSLIHLLRKGLYNASRTGDLVGSSKVHSAKLKNELYLNILETAQHLRTFQHPPRREHRFSSTGFTEDIAANLKVTPGLVRFALKNMRVDYIMFQTEVGDTVAQQAFIELAGQYLYDFTQAGKPLDRISKVRLLRERWNGHDVDFYRMMYQTMGVRAIATWVPYEVEALTYFYERRQTRLGDILTPFDQLVLNSYLDEKSPVKTAQRVRTLTGINYDKSILHIHRDALVYGRLGHPYRSQKS